MNEFQISINDFCSCENSSLFIQFLLGGENMTNLINLFLFLTIIVLTSARPSIFFDEEEGPEIGTDGKKLILL